MRVSLRAARGRPAIAATAALALCVPLAAVALARTASAAPGCRVDYTVNQWNTGFTANVAITNLGDPLTSWSLTWSFGGNQRITSAWNGRATQNGAAVTLANESYNGTLGTNASVTPGFQATYSGTNATPGSFALNGTTCTGAPPTTTPPPTDPTDPPPTTDPPPNGSHVANAFSGARGYINPDYAAQVRTAATQTGGTLGTQMARVANFPTAVWLDRIAAVTGGTGVTRTLRGHLDAALAQAAGGSTPVVATFVVYDLPNRDCAALASNGELLIAQNGLARYKSEYIDPIAAAVKDAKYANLRIALVVEPDSLPNLVTNLSTPACAEANSSGAYVQGIQYAINQLRNSNVYMYLDIAHSGWLGWDSNFGPAVNMITSTVRGTTGGLNSIDGFISATANYTPFEEPFLTDSNATVGGQQVKSAAFYEFNPYLDERDFGTAMRAAFINAGFPSGIGMLVDTSRSGWGGSARPTAASTSTDLNTYVNASKIDRRPHRGGWCNQNGAGIGARPAASPAAGFDAFVWVKPPGESDGVASNVTDPNDPAKKFDAMCDPNAQNRYNNAYPTNALPGAPHAGRWFQAQFEMLVRNAFPAI